MPADFRVTGADQIARAARALKEQGPAGAPARREMLRTIQFVTAGLKDDVRDSARTTLPRRGGLNEVVANSPIVTRTRTSGSSIGVRIVATGKPLRDVEATNRGRLRHPVFGNRQKWVTQLVKPGWFTRPLETHGPAVAKEIVSAMEQVVRNIARGSR